MRSTYGLTVVSFVGMMFSYQSTTAQTVLFSGSGYNQTVNPPTIGPYGQFSVPAGANNREFRVAVDYGLLSFGVFSPYGPNTPGTPNRGFTATQAVNNVGGQFNWSMAAQNGSGVDNYTQIRANFSSSTGKRGRMSVPPR